MKPVADPRLVVLLGVACSSSAAIFSRFTAAPSLIISAYRLGWTLLLMLPVVLLRNRAELKSLTRRNLLLCSLSGVMLGIHFILWFESLKWSSVAVSTMLVCTEVIFSSLGYALFLHGSITPKGIVSIFITFGGSALLALAGGHAGGTLKGAVMALLAAILLSVYTLIGKDQRKELSTSAYTTVTYSACFAVLFAISLFSRTPLTGYGSSLLWVTLLIAVVATFLGHNIFSWGLKYLSPAYISAMKLCAPLFSAPLAFFLLGETIRPLQLLGGAVAIFGVFLFTLAEREKSEASVPAEVPEKLLPVEISSCNLEKTDI